MQGRLVGQAPAVVWALQEFEEREKLGSGSRSQSAGLQAVMPRQLLTVHWEQKWEEPQAEQEAGDQHPATSLQRPHQASRYQDQGRMTVRSGRMADRAQACS